MGPNPFQNQDLQQQAVETWGCDRCGKPTFGAFESQKPLQLLRYPLFLLLLSRPQRYRRLPRLEPELHHHIAPDRHSIQPRSQLLSADVIPILHRFYVGARL